MVTMRTGGWTVEVFFQQDTSSSQRRQMVQVKDRGFVVYRGDDLVKAQRLAELAGLPWADLQLVDDSGAAAAG
ncbi:hypothetical protein [Cryptosporangium phraense]|uniref:Uncharacterized protein n=1 Tax=Cryptosporangium phraense TaxID=2593070 RepID=A0A545AN50_9ACTN|nr:hypothetical protein [Cryptosporangium phraense]TQS42758.1 hypothetical protein FL583_22090 [Cryptosporangium phraense]